MALNGPEPGIVGYTSWLWKSNDAGEPLANCGTIEPGFSPDGYSYVLTFRATPSKQFEKVDDENSLATETGRRAPLA